VGRRERLEPHVAAFEGDRLQRPHAAFRYAAAVFSSSTSLLSTALASP
jgi:hypothetical protein